MAKKLYRVLTEERQPAYYSTLKDALRRVHFEHSQGIDSQWDEIDPAKEMERLDQAITDRDRLIKKLVLWFYNRHAGKWRPLSRDEEALLRDLFRGPTQEFVIDDIKLNEGEL